MYAYISRCPAVLSLSHGPCWRLGSSPSKSTRCLGDMETRSSDDRNMSRVKTSHPAILHDIKVVPCQISHSYWLVLLNTFGLTRLHLATVDYSAWWCKERYEVSNGSNVKKKHLNSDHSLHVPSQPHSTATCPFFQLSKHHSNLCRVPKSQVDVWTTSSGKLSHPARQLRDPAASVRPSRHVKALWWSLNHWRIPVVEAGKTKRCNMVQISVAACKICK